jgi:phosphoribosylanthranilate isomerase
MRRNSPLSSRDPANTFPPVALLIKICGITNLADAQAAVGAGADALGFMFYRPSKRFIEATAARSIIEQLPARIAKVGVFVDATEAEVGEAIAATGIDTLQFHGEETPEFCAGFRPLRIWKAFRMADADSLRTVRFHFEADAWLLDSHVAGSHGGTGNSFDWDLAIGAKQLGRPVILAGGLNPENAAAAVAHVRPFGLDVSSGVESAPGKKDHAKIAAFIHNARAAEQAIAAQQ